MKAALRRTPHFSAHRFMYTSTAQFLAVACALLCFLLCGLSGCVTSPEVLPDLRSSPKSTEALKTFPDTIAMTPIEPEHAVELQRIGKGLDALALEKDLQDSEELKRNLQDPTFGPDNTSGQLFILDRQIADLTLALTLYPEESEVHHRSSILLAQALLLSSRFQRKGSKNVALTLLDWALERDPRDPQIYWHRAQALLALSRPREAIEALQKSALLGSTQPTLKRRQATAMMANGQREEARKKLNEYIASRDPKAPSDPFAEQLSLSLSGKEKEIRFGLDGASLVHYKLRSGARWEVRHESLGFTLTLPLSWQITNERVEEDGSGELQILAPPILDQQRRWRIDTMTLWIVRLQPGEEIDAFSSSYQASLQNLQEIEAQTASYNRRGFEKMIRKPNAEEELHGMANISLSNGMGYVLEFWGDPQSFQDSSETAASIFESFHLLSKIPASTFQIPPIKSRLETAMKVKVESP